jgi:hypothetical protein
MTTNTIGLGAFYVFNHKKLSFKAAYVRNAKQIKSAGSFLLGGFYNYNFAGNKENSGFIPEYFPTSVKDSFDIKTININSSGISFGYTYTLVLFKHFFINTTFTPGIGLRSISLKSTREKRKKDFGGTANLALRTALGYENKLFIIGITAYSTTVFTNFKNLIIHPKTSNLKFFIAKRFNVKKKRN